MQIQHGSARTTPVTRREIQKSEESIGALSRRLVIHRRTVSGRYRWNFARNLPMGPGNPRTKVLSEVREALCLLNRRRTRLPLDDCPYGLRKTVLHLSRSTPHHCPHKHGISRLPELRGGKPGKGKKLKDDPVGYIHVDIAEASTGEGRLQLFVAIDRTCKYVHAEVHRNPPLPGLRYRDSRATSLKCSNESRRLDGGGA